MNNMNLNCVGPLIHRFISANTCIVFGESADAESQLDALISAILYRALEHLQIFFGGGGVLELIPHEYQGS